MNNRILPLGSVVKLHNGDETELLIVVRAALVKENGTEVYYDYGAVLIPQGLFSAEEVYFFNKDNIKEVVFRGYENFNEQIYADTYDEMIKSTNIRKGEV